MWDLTTLDRLNQEREQRLKAESAEHELEYEEARKIDTRNKD